MLEALGNIGDLLGGVGVFVTLIYLAVQIRQNTIASRSEAYQAAVVATSAWTQDVGTDSDSTRILQAGIYDHESLGLHGPVLVAHSVHQHAGDSFSVQGLAPLDECLDVRRGRARA